MDETAGLTSYSLPNDKVLDLSDIKASTDDKIKRDSKREIRIGYGRNSVGKTENAGYHTGILQTDK